MLSLKRAWTWFDDRTGVSTVFNALMPGHIVPSSSASWFYVFGSATLFAFIIQVITGVTLAFMYVPAAGEAYQSLQYITDQTIFGRVVRGMHNWGASAMILLVGIHMIRVYLTAAYKFPREMHWITGVVLLALTVVMGFTGQVVRWDQTAVWSTIVAAEQAGRIPFIGRWVADFLIGGGTIGGATLSRMFAYHVFLIPGLLFIFIGFHLYLVFKNGISEMPRAGDPVDPKTYRREYEEKIKKDGVPFWPDAAWRDMVFSFCVITIILLIAIIIGPPALDAPPNPSNIDALPVPDWYFVFYFAFLALSPPQIESYLMIGGPLIIGLLLFLLPFISNHGERSPLRRPWAIAIVVLFVGSLSGLWAIGITSPWSPNFQAEPLTAEIIGVSSGQIYRGGEYFNEKGCLYCHKISGHGGERGPDLTYIGDKLSANELTWRIMNGGLNMPGFGGTLTSEELADLVAFLKSRTQNHP
ncbi:MAG: cytochrome b N-terminal domain-containing protein [Thermodesulfobacteriota bacterium]